MTVPAAARTLDLIEAFARERRPLSISSLAKAMGVPVSSCHGLVKTLEARGFLVALPDGGYYFTRRLLQQAQEIGGVDPLPDWVVPLLAQLRNRCNETVVLAKLVNSEASYVEVLESEQSVRFIVKTGDTRPLYASAVGKALLSLLHDGERREIIRNIKFVKRSERTLASAAALTRDLEESMARGWFMTQGEFHEDVTAIAIPMQFGSHCYACAIAGPSRRIEARFSAHVQAIGELAREVKSRGH